MNAPRLISVSQLADHPQNPRIALREDVVAAIVAGLSEGYDAAHSLIVRPHGDGYQVLSGHHRKAAAVKAGIDAVPCWVRELDDDAAYMALVTSNSQGELSPLEIGMHALNCVALSEGGRGKKGGLSGYADLVGKSPAFITQIVNAARVANGIKPLSQLNGLEAKTQHLNAIHALPTECWASAVQIMLDKGWSAKDTKHWIDLARGFDISERWKSVFLPMADVVDRFLNTREFSPATVKRLINEAERVELMLDSHGRPADDWLAWLSENAGEASWDIRKVSLRGREIENEIEADTSDRVTWLQGEWQAHVGTLEDGSVSAIVTDPPYGVGYQSDYTLDRREDRKHAPIANDAELEGAETQLRDSLAALYPKLKADASVFVFCSWRNEIETRAAVEAAGLKIRNSLVWVKNRTGMGDPNTTFAPKHERIVFAVKGSPKLAERLPDVLEADRPDSSRHPTEKPTALLTQLIGVVTAPGDLVVDPFGGVASTLVAALESGRRAWGTELSTEYHAAGKERFQ